MDPVQTLALPSLADDLARFEDSPDDFYRQIMNGSMLFQGLTDQTLGHDQRWLFIQLAKHLERVDVTARVIETKKSHAPCTISAVVWLSSAPTSCRTERATSVGTGWLAGPR